MAMTRVIAVDGNEPQPDRIRDAADVLRRGGLVAFPTETVYGLGANALDAQAVARIFVAKGRPPTDPVIVHLAHADQLELVARHVPPLARDLAAAFWPGALTVILEKVPTVPDALTAGLPTVAVRVPSHAVAHALIEAADVPVAAPSANRFSRPSPTSAEHVLADLDGRIELVVDGGSTLIGVESTIVDLTVSPPVIRRPGGVALQDIRRVIPDVRLVSAAMPSEQPQPAPGQLLRHYAPRATMTLYLGEVAPVSERVAADIRAAVAAGGRVGILAPEDDLRALAPRLAAIGSTGRVVTMRCGSRSDRDEAARDLFHALRALDAEIVDAIYAIAPDGDGINTAIIDRLTRASEGRVHRVIVQSGN
jgi:L-threonylcarbamoyladenylate synthase